MLVLAIGSYYSFARKRGPYMFLLALAASYLAFAFRHNAVIAVAPLLGLLSWKLLSKPGRAPRRAVVLASFLAIACLLLFSAVRQLTLVAYKVPPAHPSQGLALYDLGALSVYSGRNLAPSAFVLPGATVDDVRRVLDPYNGGWMTWGARPVYRFSEKPADLEDLARAWLRAVWDHPAAYLSWREQVFAAFAGLKAQVLQPYLSVCAAPGVASLVFAHGPWHRAATAWLEYSSQSVLFRCYAYLILLALMTGYGVWRRRVDIVLIAMGGFLYGTAYFLIVYQSTFRFACPTVFIAVVLAARILGEESGAKAPPRVVPGQ